MRSTLPLAFLVALFGCPGGGGSTPTEVAEGSSGTTGATTGTMTGSDPSTTNSVDSTSTSTPMVTSSTSSAGSTGPDTSETTGSGTDDGESSTSEIMEETGSESTTGMPSRVCDTMDPDPCTSCVSESCCPEVEACALDGDEVMGCSCLLDCFTGGMDPLQCATLCGVEGELLDPLTPTGAMVTCTLNNCDACLP